jgi:hypothetical protein
MSSAAYPVRRSHWLMFAAVMLLVAAGVNLVWALNLFADAGWVSDVSASIAGGSLWAWGLWDALMAGLCLFAAWDLLRGVGAYGKTIGITVAAFSIVRWLYWTPFAPLTAFAIILIDILIVYGLLTAWDTDEA